ncbi:MAG: BatA domain-containing protein [Zavarzinella sp.]
MLALFSNPFAMIAGVLLISSPIIIHLINRMRYKRIRWAAMEFLLKSQKRARRKMIIEQLILLLLRCLLVALMGLLLARFIGCDKAGNEGQNTFHIILIDDTLSMSDEIRTEEGQTRKVYDRAKVLITDQILKSANQASSPQFVTVVRLSELNVPRPFGRLNSTITEEVGTYLAPLQPTLKHIDLVDGIKAAQAQFNDEKNMRGVLHIISDFRNADWSEKNKEALSTALDELNTQGVEIHMLDCVSPERTEQNKSPLSNDNLAIVELIPDARIVARYQPVEFTVKVHNYSNSEKKNITVRVRVNGAERAEGLVNIPSVPPNNDAIGRFTLAFERTAAEENEELIVLQRYNMVSCHLEGESSGLSADNVLYSVVEVRDRVPLLIVDNSPKDRGTKQAESYFLETLFTAPIRGYDVQLKNAVDLDTLNLSQYAAIFICDTPRLSQQAIANLENYTRAGGGVAFFMGPSIRSDSVQEYNEKLYREGNGLYPVPLERVVADIPDDRRDVERLKLSLTFNKKLLIKKDSRYHPALSKIYREAAGGTIADVEAYEKFFNFVVIDRYVKVNTRAMAAGPGGPETLVYLANNKPIKDFEPAVRSLTDKLAEKLTNASEYQDYLGRFRSELRTLAGSDRDLYELSIALTNLLEDTGDETAKRPNLVKFWEMEDNKQLAREFAALRDEVTYGDPLYVTRRFGNGRVVAFMAGAGSNWNDLEGFGRPYYPPMMLTMKDYLASAGTDTALVLGQTLDLELDQTNYDSKGKQYLLSEDIKKNQTTYKSLGDISFSTGESKGKINFTFNQANEPGVYLFKLFSKQTSAGGAPDAAPTPVYRMIPCNIDVERESDLQRANSDDIAMIAPKALLHSASDDSYAEALMRKRKDFSENPWIYFIILMVLVAEQAMATRLSYNSRSAEGPPAAQTKLPVTTDI